MRKKLLTLAAIASLGISSIGCKDFYERELTVSGLPRDELSFQYGVEMKASGNQVDSLNDDKRNYREV